MDVIDRNLRWIDTFSTFYTWTFFLIARLVLHIFPATSSTIRFFYDFGSSLSANSIAANHITWLTFPLTPLTIYCSYNKRISYNFHMFAETSYDYSINLLYLDILFYGNFLSLRILLYKFHHSFLLIFFFESFAELLVHKLPNKNQKSTRPKNNLLELKKHT